MARTTARTEPEPGDLTAQVGGFTDVAPLGVGAKPAHELTADEDVDVADWDRVAAMSDFKALIAAKVRFIVPATIFFIIYYFALPILVGYFPSFMDTPVLGPVNLAYLFALSQFFMAWTIAYLYLRRAGHFDVMEKRIVSMVTGKKGGN